MGTAVADLDGAPEALAQHHQSGVEELINIFADRWQSLYRIAMRQLENGADAEDAVQDAFLSAYTHLDQFKRQARMSTWVTTIVINSARMKLRRRSSSTRTVWSLYWDNSRGRTAQVASSSSRKEQSCSNFFRLSRVGRDEAGINRRTNGASDCLGLPLYKMNSSS